MINIQLQKIPNQAFTINLDSNRWDVEIFTANGTIVATLYLDNVLVIQGLRVVAGERIIPSKYQENGNFTLITQNQELPDYNKFSVSQFLIYASAAELDVIRATNPDYVTTDFFDPIAALPLRFAPQGYTLA